MPCSPVLRSGALNMTIYLKLKEKKGFRCYLAGLLGESKRKNVAQITDSIIDYSYQNVHSANERRLKIMD